MRTLSPFSMYAPSALVYTWLAQLHVFINRVLHPHERLRRLGEAAVDVSCAAADTAINFCAMWLPLVSSLHSLPDALRAAGNGIFHVRPL